MARNSYHLYLPPVRVWSHRSTARSLVWDLKVAWLHIAEAHVPEPPPLGYPVDNDPTPSQPLHPYIARRREVP